MFMTDRVVVVSTDCHAGLPIAEYRPYVEKQYHEMLDVAVPVQIEMKSGHASNSKSLTRFIVCIYIYFRKHSSILILLC